MPKERGMGKMEMGAGSRPVQAGRQLRGLFGLAGMGVLLMGGAQKIAAEAPANLARLPGVVAIAESTHRDRWGLDGWHAALAIDGKRDGKGDGARTAAWASDNWEYTHSLALVFPRDVAATGVTLFWAAPGDTPLTPRRLTIEGYQGGRWQALARRDDAPEEVSTTLAFAEARVSALRVSQPPDGAHPAADRRLCIAEVEVAGSVAVGALEVPAALAQQLGRELAERRQAEADARAKPQLDLAMRTPKTQGFTGIVNREDLARGRANIARHAWARRAADEMAAQASWWLDKSDEYILSLIPGDNPRACCPSFEKGCPIHGGARNSFVASMEKPYRWKCLAGGEEWFDGAVVKNPGTGAEVTVRDDGSGFLAPEGFANAGWRYHFAAAYRYFLLGKLFGTPYEGDAGGGYSGNTAVQHLALAYAYTGDARYAHKAAVMLNRLADVYRFMDGCIEGPSQRQDGYIGQTFERFWVQNIALACDLVWDEVVKDEALAAFFAARGAADYDGDGKMTPKDIAHNLQRNLLGYVYEYVHRLMPYLDGDFLIYEMGALGAVTATLGNGDLAREMLEGDYGLRFLMSTEFFRDGKFIYDSSGYNVGNAMAVASLAEWLHGFRDGRVYKEPLDLYNDPRYRMGELYRFCRFIACDGRLPQIGDGGGSRGQALSRTPGFGADDERALLRLKGERALYAARLQAAAGGNVDASREGRADYWLVFHADDGSLTPLPPSPARSSPRRTRLGRGGQGGEGASHLFLDSGIAILRAGTRPETRWHIPLTFSKGGYGHGHPDKLAINLIAGGYDLSADLGYPTTWTGAKYGGWETHTASHWTVMPDGRGQHGGIVGKLGLYDTSPWVDVVEASCEAAYPECPLYRRTVALVRRGPGGEPLYAVDLFRVAGGTVRDYLHHSLGKPEEMRLDLAGAHGEWTAQAKGTLAGEGVEFGSQPGYGFLKDVRRLAYDGALAAEWRASGSSQPDRYLWTRAAYGDFDIEFTVERTGKASGSQERAVLVFGVDAANPGNRRQLWIDVAGTLLSAGKPARVSVEVRGEKAAVRVDGQLVERAVETIGKPPARGRVGFLHYYNYSLRYDDLALTPVGEPALKQGFEAPLDKAVWERIDPTYRAAGGALVASDAENVALRLLVPGGLGPGAEVITAIGEGYGLLGRSPWEAHLIVRDRKEDPAAVSTFASVLEVHRGAPQVASARRLALSPVGDRAAALRVEAGGRVDYVLSSLDAGTPLALADGGRRIAFQGRFGWLSVGKDGRMHGRLVGGGHLRCGKLRIEGPGDLQGTLVATDVEKSTLRVRLAGQGAAKPQAGQLLMVTNPAFTCPSVYRISGAARQKDGTWALALGGTPLAVGWGRVGKVDEKAGAFASATPLLKLRVIPGLFNGRRVRPSARSDAAEFRLAQAEEGGLALTDPAGLKHFRPGQEYYVYDVGAGDGVRIIGAAGSSTLGSARGADAGR